MSVLRIANGSGFYGDRLSAPLELVQGGPIDVLTGDYLAELTLSILAKDRQKNPDLGYAKTFPLQLRRLAAPCLDRGIKIVVNAGGLNPEACADACRAIYAELGLEARVAHIDGDDLLPRLADLQADGKLYEHGPGSGSPRLLEAPDQPILGANVYLGARGIAKALELGADLVICPRVTDASLVVGPAVWFHGWDWQDLDRLAGAVAVGHVLECGAQATGGNFSGFRALESLTHPGFPIAELHADGSAVITKHPGEPNQGAGAVSGAVTVDTVTAQLLYEIDAPAYLNPDVTAWFDRVQLEQQGPDRVHLSGTRGTAPPEQLKVCINRVGGFRNSVTFLLSGLDIEAKAELAEETLWRRLGGRESFEASRVTLNRAPDSSSDYDASFSTLRIAVKDQDPAKVGRRFTSAAVEMALASYPGFNLSAPPGKEQPFAVYHPALVSRDLVQERVVLDGKVHEIETPVPAAQESTFESPEPGPAVSFDGPSVLRPLGHLVHARSGDKGGNANVGLWVADDRAWPWLRDLLTVEKLQELLPEARQLQVDRFAFPNLRALNFVLHGFLGDGVASCLRPDGQAKGLGEFLRARTVPVPESLLPCLLSPYSDH